MTGLTSITKRLATGLALVAALSVGVAPVALAGHQDLGPHDALTQIRHTVHGPTPMPDAVERYVRSHAPQPNEVFDRRSPDAVDAAFPADQSVPTADVVAPAPSSFDWQDAGIGAGAMFGIAFLAGTAMLLARLTRTRLTRLT
jgi:hypothetical protein